MSKKKDKKSKSTDTSIDYKAEVKRLRRENKELRSTLEQIARLASDISEPESTTALDLLSEETADIDHETDKVLVAGS